MTKNQESSFLFWPCYYVGLLCDNMMWFDYVTSTGLLLPCMLFRYYFSGVVLINYLAYGMLQINMIWQNVVRPRQYINNGDTIFLTQLWVLVRCQMFINIYIKGYIASQAIIATVLLSLLFAILQILTSASCWEFCDWYLFYFSPGWSSVARTRPQTSG